MIDSLDKIVAEMREHLGPPTIASRFAWANRLESLARQHREEVEAAEAALGEAREVLRQIQQYDGDPRTPVHNSVKKSAIARAYFTRTSKETRNG